MKKLFFMFVSLVSLVSCSSDAPTIETKKTSVPKTLGDWAKGSWRYDGNDGVNVSVQLYPDGSALSNQGGIGSWYFIDNHINILWMDGWTDQLIKSGSEYIKKGYAPGQSSDGSPTNHSTAVKTEAKPENSNQEIEDNP
jgi:hypothetical protein